MCCQLQISSLEAASCSSHHERWGRCGRRSFVCFLQQKRKENSRLSPKTLKMFERKVSAEGFFPHVALLTWIKKKESSKSRLGKDGDNKDLRLRPLWHLLQQDFTYKFCQRHRLRRWKCHCIQWLILQPARRNRRQLSGPCLWGKMSRGAVWIRLMKANTRVEMSRLVCKSQSRTNTRIYPFSCA